MSKGVIKVFIKNLEVGKVKTRLAASIGNEDALNIYEKLISFTRKTVSEINADKEIWYSSYVDDDDDWESHIYIKYKQKGNDLGERMKYAFSDSFLNDKEAKVLLIGSDCAELTAEILEEAFQKLEKNDIVLGPAVDGGYYLIGMSKFYPSIFEKVSWSTSEVLDQTIEKAKEQGLRYALLKELHDVDTLEDWDRVKERVMKS